MKKTVALVYGGEGAERHISKRSAAALYPHIDREKYGVVPVYINPEGSWYITERDPFGASPTVGARPTFPVRIHGVSGLLTDGRIMKTDCAIPLLHGDLGEDGVIAGVLRAAHIPFVGEGVGGSALCADKIYTKLVADSLGIRSADWLWARGTDTDSILSAKRRAEEKLGYPMFIKPSSLGSSIGASAVPTEEDFIPAYTGAARYGRVLIERQVDVDCEVECALLTVGGKRRISASGIVRTGSEFYSFERKYGKAGPRTLHGVEKTDTLAEIERMAEALADAIGLGSMARLDFFIDRLGRIYFNEINVIPGMTEASLYPRLTEDMGFAPFEFINLLIEEATV